jgi:sigma-B regulation protein RsbU (phosphoserine phosphatase)
MADITNLNHVVLALGIGGLMLLALAVVFIARSITRPLTEMADIAGRIGTGDLEAHVPEVRTRDEVGKLASALDCMKTSLKDYIREITDTTAARQRMESELKIARNIQMGILPKEFPPFPDRTDFDIHALTVPAREVGGDFYDFFLIDREHLCIVIGDASGKGIPAALFMAFTKTLIKARASADIETGVLMGEVNDELSREIPRTCSSPYSAPSEHGHGRAAIYERRPQSACHYSPRWQSQLSRRSGELVVGIMDGTQYTTRTLTLNPGDGLFLYTDGVTEAMNAAGEIFSTDRLKDVLATVPVGMSRG